MKGLLLILLMSIAAIDLALSDRAPVGEFVHVEYGGETHVQPIKGLGPTESGFVQSFKSYEPVTRDELAKTQSRFLKQREEFRKSVARTNLHRRYEDFPREVVDVPSTPKPVAVYDEHYEQPEARYLPEENRKPYQVPPTLRAPIPTVYHKHQERYSAEEQGHQEHIHHSGDHGSALFRGYQPDEDVPAEHAQPSLLPSELERRIHKPVVNKPNFQFVKPKPHRPKVQDIPPRPRSKAPESDYDPELFRQQAESAKYNFASAVSDSINDHSHIRQESRNGLKLSGVYSYSDGFFKHTVHYEADEKGYRVVKQDQEPIGDGPNVNPDGRIDVRTDIAGASLRYSVDGSELQRRQRLKEIIEKTKGRTRE